MNRNRRLWIGVASVLALAVVAIVALGQRRPAPSEAGPAAPSVPLATAHAGTVEQQIAVQGRVGPPAGSSAKIAFAQPGILQRVDVRVGERVSAGTTVAELDRATLGSALQQAQADAQAAGPATETSAAARLALAQQRLQTLQRGGPAALSTQIAAAANARQAALKVQSDEAALGRSQQLLAAGVVATKDVDAARAQLASDRADRQTADAKVATAGTDFEAAVKQAEADVASARNDVQVATGQVASARARTTTARIAFASGLLTAPADGVVLAILKRPGESVDTTQPVMEIGAPLGASVTLTLAADAARRVHVGDPVTLTTPVHPGTTAATVAAVVPAVDPTTQLGTVVVRGVPPDAVPGDAVNATITVGRARGIVVPTSAIVQDPQTGKMVVFVRDPHPKAGDSPFAMRGVVVRASTPSLTSVASGLQSGERIAAQGGYALLAPAGGS